MNTVSVKGLEWNDPSLYFSCLQGTVLADYETLCEIFGQPSVDDHIPFDGKTSCCWVLKFTDEVTKEVTYARVYNYKTQTEYCNPVYWHVGGFNLAALELVTRFVDGR